MNNQVFDEGTGPALGDSHNVLLLIDSEETMVGGKLVVILQAGPPFFKCPNVAAALRVASPFLGGTGYDHALMGAGALWSIAFLLFLLVYLPILVRRRAG